MNPPSLCRLAMGNRGFGYSPRPSAAVLSAELLVALLTAIPPQSGEEYHQPLKPFFHPDHQEVRTALWALHTCFISARGFGNFSPFPATSLPYRRVCRSGASFSPPDPESGSPSAG